MKGHKYTPFPLYPTPEEVEKKYLTRCLRCRKALLITTLWNEGLGIRQVEKIEVQKPTPRRK